MSSADAKAGFTLIEMMAVMMIIALISSLVVTIIPGTGRAGLKAVVMNSAALLRRARVNAMMTGHDQHVALDDKDRRLIGDGGDQVEIPPDVVVDVLGTNQIWAEGVAVAAFHADGASTGTALKFSREGVSYEVRVNWYTGAVTINTP